MRKAPLKSRTPLQRTRPLVVRSGLKRRTAIKSRSRKMQRVYEKQRIPLVKKVLGERPLCQRCLMSRSEEVHEIVPRSRGGSITDEDNVVALCHECHAWITTRPKLATEEGWLRRREHA